MSSADVISSVTLPRRVRNWTDRARQNTTSIVTAFVVAVLVLPPLVTVLYSSFVAGDDVWHGSRTLGHYRDILGAGSSWTATKNTFIFATGSALVSVAAAAGVAFLTERTNAPFRRFAYASVFVSFGVPTVIQAMGWILLIGPNSSFVNTTLHDLFGSHFPTINLFTMSAMIFIQSTILFPAMFMLIAPSLRMADPALEQAAAVSGAGRMRVLWSITFRLIAPSLLAAALLAFIITTESFEVPALVGTPAGIRVLSTTIYGRINTFQPDFGAAAAFAVLLMAVTVVGLYLYQRATARAHRFVTVSGKGYRPERIDLLKLRWPAGLVTVAIPFLVIAPVLILLWTSLLPFYAAPSLHEVSRFTLSNYGRVLHTPDFLHSAKNSLYLGLGAAAIVMGFTLVGAWTVVRRRTLLSRSVDQLASLPLVAPGIVLSLAVLRVFIKFPIRIYGTMWILLLAFVIHYLPYGFRYNSAGIVALHPELEEAAEVSGASRVSVFVRVVAPLMRPTLLAGGLFVFLASVRQLSLVVLLTGVNMNVVASEIFNLWGIGSLTDAATASMLVVVGTLLVAGVLYGLVRLGRRGADVTSLQVR
jgi:iron(III) transport system permease protein